MDWLKKFKSLKLEFLYDYLPQTGLESVSWIEFMKQSSGILKLSADQMGLKKIRQRLRNQLCPEFVDSSEGLISLREIAKEDEDTRRFWGEKILKTYFESVLASRLLNLDFRPETFYFSSDIKTPRAHWALSRFNIVLTDDFSASLGLLYKGYYEQRPKDFRQALIELSLLGAEQDSSEIENLLYGYFGQAGEKPIRFETKKFKTSFFELFKYLKKHKRKVPANFMWVGLALAGVYDCLELLDTDYRVREVFLNSKKMS